jgi:hypothetical protein
VTVSWFEQSTEEDTGVITYKDKECDIIILLFAVVHHINILGYILYAEVSTVNYTKEPLIFVID